MPCNHHNHQARPKHHSTKAEINARLGQRKVVDFLTAQNTMHNAGPHRPSSHPSRGQPVKQAQKPSHPPKKPSASTPKSSNEPAIIARSMETAKDGSFKKNKVEISRDGRYKEYEIVGSVGYEKKLTGAHKKAIDRMLGH